MQIITRTYLSAYEKQITLKIWNAEYPVHLQIHHSKAFDGFLATLINPTYYLLLNDDDEIVGWASVFLRENVRYFFIILTGNIHGKSYGTILINEIKKNEIKLFGWAVDHDNDTKANGEPYLSPLAFYSKNGFTIDNNKRLETDTLSAVQITWERNR